MDGKSDVYIPSENVVATNDGNVDRRRFLKLATVAGVGLGCARGSAAREPRDNVALPVIPPEARACCGNTPRGGPYYEGVDGLSVAVAPGQGGGDKALWDLDRVWDIGETIIVRFLNGQNSPWGTTVHNMVKEIAPTWCDYANVKLQFVDSGPCFMTVNFRPFVQAGRFFEYGTLFNSFVGEDCYRFMSQVQSMNLLFSPLMERWNAELRESEFQRLILHEFGHALGLQHEHQRPDRPIVWNTERLNAYAGEEWGWNPMTVKQQIIDTVQYGNFSGTVFDVSSIMMYEYPPGLAFYQKMDAAPGTPDYTKPFSSTRNTKLTPLDKISANVAYPKKAPQIGQETLTLGAASRVGKIIEAGQVARYVFRPGAEGNYKISVGGAMPALVGLFAKPSDSNSRGNASNILSAAEASSGGTVLSASLKADTAYHVEVRHAKPLTGTGEFNIRIEM